MLKFPTNTISREFLSGRVGVGQSWDRSRVRLYNIRTWSATYREARRFSLKLREIVEEERGGDFILRLHRGKLDIIPWPVVETKEFYRLFTILKGRLDRQKISYPTAGTFLHTIKTLMAKIMVCRLLLSYGYHCSQCLHVDKRLGSAFSFVTLSFSLTLKLILMTDTMAKLRAKTLSTLLWSALSTGFAETEPQFVPLKVP